MKDSRSREIQEISMPPNGRCSEVIRPSAPHLLSWKCLLWGPKKQEQKQKQNKQKPHHWPKVLIIKKKNGSQARVVGTIPSCILDFHSASIIYNTKPELRKNKTYKERETKMFPVSRDKKEQVKRENGAKNLKQN